MAQMKITGNGVATTIGMACLLLSISVNICSAASRVMDSADVVDAVGVEASGGQESASSAVTGQNRQAKFVINGPEISSVPLEKLFGNQTEGNSSSPSPFPFGPVATSVALTKTALVAVLGGLKAALPQAILFTAIFAFLITGIAYFVCSITECGVTSPLTVRGSSPFDNDILNRNTYEYDYEKFRPVYHAIDDHKFKYNQIHQDKEFFAPPTN